MFLGGCTFSEISALRLLAKKLGELSTDVLFFIVKGTTWIWTNNCRWK